MLSLSYHMTSSSFRSRSSVTSRPTSRRLNKRHMDYARHSHVRGCMRTYCGKMAGAYCNTIGSSTFQLDPSVEINARRVLMLKFVRQNSKHLATDLTSKTHTTLVVGDLCHLIAGTRATPFSWLLVISSTLHRFPGQQSKFAAYRLVRIRQS